MIPLVFLHGWAQSRQAWFQQQAVFPDALYLNLPGHGGSEYIKPEQWAEHITAQLPETPCLLVGWSLGGMLALDIARRFPERLAAMALVGASPCFQQQPDWPNGCKADFFTAFEQAVSSASPRLFNRFFALMLHGDNLSRSSYNTLARQAVDRQHPTSQQGLSAGLELLAGLDSRTACPTLELPTLVIHGEQDAVVSVQAGCWLAKTIPRARLQVLPECGHAPQLTRADTFNQYLFNWWHTL